jgi:hypothetical protein
MPPGRDLKDMSSVRCGSYSRELDEPATLSLSERRPCPDCGSTARRMGVALVGEQPAAYGALRAKARHGDKGKPFATLKQGKEPSRDLGRLVDRLYTTDREADRWYEKVVDPETGDIIHEVDESLSGHQGHGSAKQRDPDA